MSTTKWRGRSLKTRDDDSSPRRPSLSPTPLPSSPVYGYDLWQSKNFESNGRYIRGLGLSGTHLNTEDTNSNHPNRLYIDPKGGAHVVNGPARSKNSREARSVPQLGARESGRKPRSNKRKNHTRSGSTIDDLADAAIATSPRFGATSPDQYGSSPTAFSHTRPVTSYVNGYHLKDPSFDRPAKRIRSQAIPFTDHVPLDERPSTSHTSEYQSPRPEEAELLLGLRYAWGLQAFSPAPAPAGRVAIQHANSQTAGEADVSAKSEEGHGHVDNIAEHNKDDSTKPPEQVVSEEPNERRSQPQSHEGMDTSEEGLPQTLSTGADDASTQPPQEDAPKLESIDKVQPADQVDQQPQDPTATSTTSPAQSTKKPRKIQPQVQAEVCASCMKLQRDANDEDSTTQWIGCEHCKKWFHTACAGFRDKQEARAVDKFYCSDCHGTHGTTTFVRKSSRTRTAIDYAGLNEGVIKPSDESSMHHYIQPIKNGQIKYQQDDFARIRPELLTAEFWESMDGMKRPFVVPACWNPRFGAASEYDNGSDSINAEPIMDEHNLCFSQEGESLGSLPQTTAKTEVEAFQSSEAEVIDTDQDYLDMVMPRNLTVRRVAELYGPEQPVPVIDVKSQETKGQFTLADWATYYEEQGDKPIRNVISLEVSNSRLGRLIRRPRVVRDIDLEDHVWDYESRSSSNKRPVQFYCLMSVADSYTDFHIDFGGSSVYYHILKGVKTFFFIPPEDRYLKKYEEWCNSDTQNETWLGDLCGGNVTRVDLHEGDTAFIPAGWIHSVWTPEDSLVIGGNFLTQLDYELQLKVANIEKTTRVPLMFRYPFFQKVMWYTLLKYLQDDPVPEEVLRDFHEDDDFRYLRANPIYMDLDDSMSSAEPGTPEFNARIYPKSELKGLSALRDYLYRTARIHADLPVPDVNKKQIDAVKASIPKGHGDPMQLIKTFAVWCAWKIGNETVPEWVHTDFGGLLPELKEMEKIRKVENFRMPPERVSARKPKDNQSNPTVLETASPDSKPVKSPESDDSAHRRNDSKSSSSRIACEACRKRRIKCRHKEGDVSPSGTSPAAIRPRTYSNVSVDVPKLASASPVINGFEPASTGNGAISDFNNTDLAQAALATMGSHSTESHPYPHVTTPVSSIKKGRSKACEECRKSKRRCVHDEYGRVDPAKAAEPSKPRGSTNAKRTTRISDEPPIRKLKLEPEIDPALATLSHDEITDAMIDPALIGEGWNVPLLAEVQNGIFDASSIVNASDHHHDANFALGDGGVTMQNEAEDARYQLNSLPPEQPPTFEAYTDIQASTNSIRQSPVSATSYSPITVDGINIAAEEHTKVARDLPLPRPYDAHSQLEQQLASEVESLSTVAPRIKTDRRASSENSAQSRATPNKSRRSSSNTSNTTHQTGALDNKSVNPQDFPARPISRGSAVISEADADEKLARELHAAENGLRRRASVRA